MNAFRAWISVTLFGGLGVAALLGYRMPDETDCSRPRRCRLNALSDMQDHLGDINTALILFLCALFSWFWFKLR